MTANLRQGNLSDKPKQFEHFFRSVFKKVFHFVIIDKILATEPRIMKKEQHEAMQSGVMD